MNSMKTPSPVLIFKPQGKMEGCSTLHPNDFVLAIQTPLQAKILKMFGPDKVICIDSTHGTNGYNFSLITVLVIDEFGEGYPVAWCLSNRTDLSVMLNFFQQIRERVGILTPKWVMSDDAEQFFTAWVAVFGSGPQKLLCTWHIDRAWRGHLKSIQDTEIKEKVYHNLRILLEETDTQKFESILSKTMEQLSQSTTTAEFCKYFNTYYVHRKEQWAACYRKCSGINTNMCVESFH